MKKIIFAGLLAVLFAAQVLAGFTVTPFAGYTSVSMAQLNQRLDFLNVTLPMLLGSSSLKDRKVSHFHDAWFAGLDAGYDFFPGFLAGLRSEFIGSGGYVYARNIKSIAEKSGVDANLIPVMAGVSYMLKWQGCPFTIGADAYAGIGFGKGGFFLNEYDRDNLENLSIYLPMSGNCLVLDGALKAAYSFGSMFSLDLSCGYRQAKFDKIYCDKDGTFFNPNWKKGKEAKTLTGDTLAPDFSGLTAKLGGNISF